MSKQEIRKFYDLVEQSDKVRKELLDLDKKFTRRNMSGNEFLKLIDEGIIPIAKRYGFNLKEEEILRYVQDGVRKISKEDLMEVSGGLSPRQVAIGLSAVLLMSLGAGGMSSVSAASSSESTSNSYATQSSGEYGTETPGSAVEMKKQKTGRWRNILSLVKKVPGLGAGINSIAKIFEKKVQDKSQNDDETTNDSELSNGSSTDLAESEEPKLETDTDTDLAESEEPKLETDTDTDVAGSEEPQLEIDTDTDVAGSEEPQLEIDTDTDVAESEEPQLDNGLGIDVAEITIAKINNSEKLAEYYDGLDAGLKIKVYDVVMKKYNELRGPEEKAEKMIANINQTKNIQGLKEYYTNVKEIYKKLNPDLHEMVKEAINSKLAELKAQEKKVKKATHSKRAELKAQEMKQTILNNVKAYQESASKFYSDCLNKEGIFEELKSLSSKLQKEVYEAVDIKYKELQAIEKAAAEMIANINKTKNIHGLKEYYKSVKEIYESLNPDLHEKVKKAAYSKLAELKAQEKKVKKAAHSKHAELEAQEMKVVPDKKGGSGSVASNEYKPLSVDEQERLKQTILNNVKAYQGSASKLEGDYFWGENSFENFYSLSYEMQVEVERVYEEKHAELEAQKKIAEINNSGELAEYYKSLDKDLKKKLHEVANNKYKELRVAENMDQKAHPHPTAEHKNNKVTKAITEEQMTQAVMKAIYGMACGDAYGVQYEFVKRGAEILDALPDTMQKSGVSHPVEAGTWSDDTSQILCTIDSIIENKGKINLRDIMERFSRWGAPGVGKEYAPNGNRFDIGGQVKGAIMEFTRADEAEKDQFKAKRTENAGNGALMRITPMSFYFAATSPDKDTRKDVKLIEDCAELTHNNKYSSMGCVIYTLMNKYLILDQSKDEPQAKLKRAFDKAIKVARAYYGKEAMKETRGNGFVGYKGKTQKNGNDYLYSRLNKGYDGFKKEIKNMDDLSIGNAYTPVTLESAMYCLMNTNNYKDCIKMAVKLGEDTDTVASIAGSTAGLLYGDQGEKGIPANWKGKLANVGYKDPKNNDVKVNISAFMKPFAKILSKLLPEKK